MKDIKEVLFKKIYPDDKLHPNYLNLVNEKIPFVKEVIMQWADGFIDRDHKFVKEFQTTFNSSFWEFYLICCIKRIRT